VLAYEGRAYAESPYDRPRYERICEIIDSFYAELTGLTAAEVGDRFRRDLGTPTPKVGATAVILRSDGLVLLDRRADDGRWGLPGGWLAPNESPEHGVVREVAEETGLDVEVVRLGTVAWWPAALPDRPHGHVGLTYLCRVRGGELRSSHESLELRWRDPAEPIEWHLDHGEKVRATLATGEARLAGARRDADAPTA
jgi:ADP-ribose pyrophosphatase YjhB (NUDIX family)